MIPCGHRPLKRREPLGPTQRTIAIQNRPSLFADDVGMPGLVLDEAILVTQFIDLFQTLWRQDRLERRWGCYSCSDRGFRLPRLLGGPQPAGLANSRGLIGKCRRSPCNRCRCRCRCALPPSFRHQSRQTLKHRIALLIESRVQNELVMLQRGKVESSSRYCCSRPGTPTVSVSGTVSELRRRIRPSTVDHAAHQAVKSRCQGRRPAHSQHGGAGAG